MRLFKVFSRGMELLEVLPRPLSPASMVLSDLITDKAARFQVTVCKEDSSSILHEILKFRSKNLLAVSFANSAQSMPIRASCLAGRFYGLKCRISSKDPVKSIFCRI